jgi:tRNA-uridine 2-sulfurtransferase
MTNKHSKIKVVVAMSGGVDSAVAAALLKKEGYDVVGVFMQFWFPKGEIYGENRCCSLESFNEAKKVADTLDIPLHKLNVGKSFKEKVVDEFLKLYRSGKTPNPCVTCNKFIKFDLLLKHARTIWGADYLATGHYARLQKTKPSLLRGKDKNKDQSYFLYNLKKKDLPHLLFPVGGYTKSEIRQVAKKLKLSVHSKSDSQEICFVGNSHYDFLKKYLKLKGGNIIDERGNILGEHSGLPLYTIGQRTGLGLAGGPWYVCGFNRRKNELTVTRDQAKSDIFSNELKCVSVNWIGGKPKLPLKCQAQIRYRTKPVNCNVFNVSGGLKVVFSSKQRAIMPGQSIVFYRGQEVLGGGVIV